MHNRLNSKHPDPIQLPITTSVYLQLSALAEAAAGCVRMHERLQQSRPAAALEVSFIVIAQMGAYTPIGASETVEDVANSVSYSILTDGQRQWLREQDTIGSPAGQSAKWEPLSDHLELVLDRRFEALLNNMDRLVPAAFWSAPDADMKALFVHATTSQDFMNYGTVIFADGSDTEIKDFVRERWA